MVVYANANGLLSKLNELKVMIDSNSIDIVCITETHISDNLEEAEICIHGFTPYRGNEILN